MTVTVITGWIAAVLLFFNFATCLAMPWAKKKFTECKEKDCKEREECHAEVLGKYHKPIVWLSILAIIIHIVAYLVT